MARIRRGPGLAQSNNGPRGAGVEGRIRCVAALRRGGAAPLGWSAHRVEKRVPAKL